MDTLHPCFQRRENGVKDRVQTSNTDYSDATSGVYGPFFQPPALIRRLLRHYNRTIRAIVTSYAVALQSTGQTGQAIPVLEQAHKKHLADRQILAGLISFERESGSLTSAIKYAEELENLVPGDPNVKKLLTDLLAQ